MRRPWSLAKKETPSLTVLHIFRALLRQCTYLPDPAARQYMHSHIVSRFRDYNPRRTLPLTSQSHRPLTRQRHRPLARQRHRPPTSQRHRPPALVQQRLPYLLRTARRGLIFLRRANDGHIRHLGRILAMTYGRIGKRRHQLLYNLKIPDIPVNQFAVKKLLEPGNQAVPHPSKQLMALIKSQAKHKTSHLSRANTPRIEPQIPKENAWGRPMPIKRVRNYKRRWYAETLDRIMPPLPQAEWEKLLMRGSGQLPWEGPVPRRKWTGGPDDEGQTHLVGEKVKSPTRYGCSNPHRITRSYMRRLWAKISANCPLIKPSVESKSGWEVVWGGVYKPHKTTFTLGPAGGRGYDVFGGVDEKGKVIPQV